MSLQKIVLPFGSNIKRVCCKCLHHLVTVNGLSLMSSNPPPPPPYGGSYSYAPPQYPPPSAYYVPPVSQYQRPPPAPMPPPPRGGYPDQARPSNTLYIRNIAYSVTPEEFHSIFLAFGEIWKENLSLIREKGVAYITFYDIRAAMKAEAEMLNRKIHNRIPKTSFLYKPMTGSGVDIRDLSLKVLLRPSREPTKKVSQQAVRDACSRFGEVWTVSEPGKNQFHVEFYDKRGCNMCVDNSGAIVIEEVAWYSELVLEMSDGMKYAPQRSQAPAPPPYSAAPPPPPYSMGPPPPAPMVPHYQGQQFQEYPSYYAPPPGASAAPPPPSMGSYQAMYHVPPPGQPPMPTEPGSCLESIRRLQDKFSAERE